MKEIISRDISPTKLFLSIQHDINEKSDKAIKKPTAIVAKSPPDPMMKKAKRRVKASPPKIKD